MLAFAAIYVIWGSTYLGIRYAIETLPPLLMAGARFLTAGSILYGFARLTGAAAPGREHWKPAAILGALMLLIGNGGVVVGERTVPSSLAALVIASEPLWIALLEGIKERTGLPRGLRLVALVVGFLAVAVLIGPSRVGGAPLDLLLVFVAAPAWAMGSLYSRSAARPASGLVFTGMQMLCGGAFQILAGSLLGEWSRFDPSAVSVTSLLALAYLIVFGSLVAFTAYAWLLRAVSPTLASTYAYVNPVVAVLLGWLLGGEPLGARTLIAAAGIVASVVLITMAPARSTSYG